MTFEIGDRVIINKDPKSFMVSLEPFNKGDVGIITKYHDTGDSDPDHKILYTVSSGTVEGKYWYHELIVEDFEYKPDQEGDRDDDI